MARTAETELVPIWRSRVQPIILHEVSLHPGLTAASIAKRHRLNRATVAAEVARLSNAGVLIATPIGRANQLSLNWDNPTTTHLVALADHTVGLLSDLAKLYAINGVSRVAVFGSWARRHLGEAGPPPDDIDVLVETTGEEWPIVEACLSVSGKRGITISPYILTNKNGDSNAITTAILAGPLVEVSEDERPDS
ncbi:MAG: hypothetical protein WC184_07560 [Acidimicrobiia bacterium]